VTLPDVNVLIYAYRNDAEHHAISRAWLDKTVASDSRFAVSKLTLAAFVRVVTNRISYPNPTLPSDAFAFCNNLLSQPNCEAIEPGERHWEVFQRLCLETNTRGRDTTDAWFAALAIEWGCEWVTFDRDFLKFPDLKCTILSRTG
jgi:toxin-antitoxin system PIN domain toxin